jgi:hypothetical protein
MLTQPAPVATGSRAKVPTARLVSSLLRPSLRLAPRTPLLLSGFVGLATAAAPVVVGAELGLPDGAMLSRVGAVAVALGAGFALDDPAAPTTVVVPVPRLLQRAVRAVPVFMAACAIWVAVAALARLAVAPEARGLFPWGGLALEAAALVVISLALAARGLPFTEGEHGAMVAAPGLVLLVIAAMLLPDQAALFVPPGHPHWASSHHVWAVLLGVGAVAGVLLAHVGSLAAWRLRRKEDSG